MRNTIRFAAVLIAAAAMPAAAQMTADYCRDKARTNYPLSRQYGLIDRAASYGLLNLNLGYVPQVTLSGKSTRQSDITSTPLMDKNLDQYQLAVDVSQTLWDGGVIGAQKKLRTAGARTDKAKVDVDLYSLDSRVDDLFFSILLLSAQLDQNALLQDELKTNAERVDAYIANGVAFRADADTIAVERIEAEQQRISLESSLASYTAMLSALMGEPIPQGTVFARPDAAAPSEGKLQNRRPELALFAAQLDQLRTQRAAAFAADSPKLSAFFWGMYGDPGLNAYQTGATADWQAGIRMTWSLGSAYTLYGTTKEIEANQLILENQRGAFLLNADLDIARLRAEIDRIAELIDGDARIIALRTRIKKSAETRVANGTLSVSDLLREINAENMAEQTKILHEIQLQKAISDLDYTVNG